MKKLLALSLIITSFLSSSSGQIHDPVTWKFYSEQIGDAEYYICFEAEVEDHWHIYATDIPDGGPVATSFTLDETTNYLTDGGIIEIGKKFEQFDPQFEMILSWYEHKVTFKQKVTSTEDSFTVSGYLTFMVCDDKQCLPPDDVDFSIKVKKKAVLSNREISQPSRVVTKEKDDTPVIKIDKSKVSVIEPKSIQTIDTTQEIIEAKEESEITSPTIKAADVDLETPVKKAPSRSLWAIFALGFGGGLFALLTPCVFPMIPLTVSFFTKQSKTKAKGMLNAILYGIAIIVIYVLLGFFITIIFGADALNELSTSVWLNLFFFIIFLVFAISFFGAFEITLPSSWINKTDRGADKGGLIGIFFMALTLSLVSFSCTGPIIGSLLVDAAVNGGVSGPIMGMAGFSTALALPFALFAAFPGWLNSLPKSGGWLNSVKVVLGFIELAAAMKFLSNADLVVQAHIVSRELFIAIWIIIFALLGFYLLGFLKFAHDSEMKFISIPRLFLAIISFAFTMYLIPGLWGAPLKLISGFPPPMFYTEWQQTNVIASRNSSNHSSSNSAHCPHNLNCFHDFDEGFDHAKQVNKPILLDFTGWACVNCRRMEENVWPNPTVMNYIQNEYILISLYVDDKTKLPKEEQYTYELDGKTKKVRTIGNKWSHLQTTRFKTNSQPYYVLLDHENQVLIQPKGYTPDKSEFAKFLKTGIEKFKK